MKERNHFIVKFVTLTLEKRNFEKHIVTLHEGKKLFKCNIYNIEFKSKQGMKGHIVIIHDGNR